jgi:AcrR family transcriptional regulator
MAEKRPNTRQRLLEAAAEISRESGAGSLSLDAVAARAGTSKGGLLYHFPTKAALMEGVVEMFVSSFAETLSTRAAEKQGEPNGLAEAYLELFVEDHDCSKPPPSGLLAALAENPDFLKPVRRFERELLDRMKENSADPALSIVIFLVALGVRNSALINLDVLTDEEFHLVTERLKKLLEAKPDQ